MSLILEKMQNKKKNRKREETDKEDFVFRKRNGGGIIGCL